MALIKYVIVIVLYISLKCIPAFMKWYVTKLISFPSSVLEEREAIKLSDHCLISRLALHACQTMESWLGACKQACLWGQFFSLQVYIIIIENLPTPTAGIPFVRLDPYLVPPDGLYDGPKSLPDGGENSLISGELSSTLQMGKSNSPFMWRTRPTRSGYSQLKTRYFIKRYNIECSFTWVRVVACIETHFFGCASIHRGLCLSVCVWCAHMCTGVCEWWQLI